VNGQGGTAHAIAAGADFSLAIAVPAPGADLLAGVAVATLLARSRRLRARG